MGCYFLLVFRSLRLIRAINPCTFRGTTIAPTWMIPLFLDSSLDPCATERVITECNVGDLASGLPRPLTTATTTDPLNYQTDLDNFLSLANFGRTEVAMLLSDMIALVKELKAVVLSRKVPELSPDMQYRIFLVCRKLETAAKDQKDAVKAALLAHIEAYGTPDEKGSQHFEFAEGRASRTKKVPSAPNVESVEKMLRARGIDPAAQIVKTSAQIVKVADVSVLEQLVKLGVLSQAELDACYDVSYSFNAYETKDTKKELLEGIG